MRLVPPEIESKLRQKGFWPESWTARAGLYVVALDIIAFVLQLLASHLRPKIAASLGVGGQHGALIAEVTPDGPSAAARLGSMSGR